MKISLIVAASANNVIGDSRRGNQVGLLWNLPNDLKHFRELTKGKPIIMGRKTMEAIGRILPGRTNIVVTRHKTVPMEGAVRAGSLQEALEIAHKEKTEEVFVIGGGQMFAEALPLADRVYLTRVHAQIEGDVLFPALDPDVWERIEEEPHQSDGEHAFSYSFEVWLRKK